MNDPYASPDAGASQAAPDASGTAASLPRAPASAVGAVVLSLLALGSGHVYAGRPKRGLAWLCVVSGGALAFGAVDPLVYRWLGMGGFVLLGLAPLGLGVAAVVDAGRLAPARTRRFSAWIVIGSVLGIMLVREIQSRVLRAYLLASFKNPSGSVLPTVAVGDHVFVDKKTGGAARRGHLIVFPFPEHPEQDFIKRVIGLPGDEIEVERGRVTINGWSVPRCPVGQWSYADYGPPTFTHDGEVWVEFLGDASYLVFEDAVGDKGGKWSVASGEAFVLGDNRGNSHDSRMWNGGAGGGVPIRTVSGEPFVVWLAVTDGGFDWSREGLDITGRRPGPPPHAEAMTPAIEECLRRRPSGTLGP
jgi:signal peptidase I